MKTLVIGSDITLNIEITGADGAPLDLDLVTNVIISFYDQGTASRIAVARLTDLESGDLTITPDAHTTGAASVDFPAEATEGLAHNSKVQAQMTVFSDSKKTTTPAIPVFVLANNQNLQL